MRIRLFPCEARGRAASLWLMKLAVNISAWRRRRSSGALRGDVGVACLCLALAALAPASFGIDLPDMGASVDSVLSPEQEKAIGRSFMRQVRAKMNVVDDPEVEEYIQSLGDNLAASSDAAHTGFTFFVVGSGAINAFAAPGGYIGVNSGLITAAQTESELAGVMAHEIAHVTQRHIARRFEAMDRMSGPMLAAMAAALLVGTQDASAGMAAAAAAQGAAAQMQIDYTRANELEADRVGVRTLANAGFDPRGMPDFFERMQRASRYYSRPPEFLSTHPVTANRIADTRGRAEQYAPKRAVDSQSFYLVRAKLKVYTARNPPDAVTYFREALKTGQHSSRVAARYGYALALARAGKPREARTAMRRLYDLSPDTISFRAELAQLEMALNNIDTAIALYEEGLALYPGNRLLLEGYLEALIQVGRPDRARKEIREYERYNDLNPTLYELLARSEELAGDSVEAHIAMGEYHYMMGSLRSAIGQYERAQKAGPRDYYQAARVDAALERLRKELNQRRKRR